MSEPESEYSSAEVFVQEQDDDSPISDTINELPSYVTRGLVYLILLFTVAGLGWAHYSKIDIIVGAPGVIVPEGRAMVVQPNISGIVRDLSVREGDFVSKGQRLAVIEADETGRLILQDSEETAQVGDTVPGIGQEVERPVMSRRMLDAETELEAKRLAHLAQLNRADAGIRSLQTEIDHDTRRQSIQTTEMEVHRKLREQDLESEMEWLQVQQIYQETLLRVQKNKDLLREAVGERELLVRSFAGTRAEYENTISRIRDQAQWTVIRAPADGVITQMVTRHRDEVVTRGQVMMSLVPDRAQLLAEIRIPNRDMGRVEVGQNVKFKFDAFPYAEYGVIVGELVKVLPSLTEDPISDTSFRALASVGQDYFLVDGARIRLRPGMTAVAEIVSEQKTILDLLIKPFRELRQAEPAQSQ